MEFHIHQDGYVVLNNTSGYVCYQDTADNFNADSGISLSLPEGMVAMSCIANVTVYYDTKQNAYPVEGPYCPDIVNSAAAMINEIAAAKVVRVHNEKISAAAALALKIAQNQPSTFGTQSL